MRQLEVIDGVCVRAIACETDGLPATEGQWVQSDDAGGPGWAYDGAKWSAPDRAGEPVGALISIREFKEIVGVQAVGRIHKRTKVDEDIDALWAYATATGDIDRSDPTFGLAMDQLLAVGDIDQDQYDDVYPEELR